MTIWQYCFYMEDFKMKFDTATNVRINSTKRDLAKAKGIKLQDLLDNALDKALEIENSMALGTDNLSLEKEAAEQEIKELEISKQLDLKRIAKEYDDKILDLRLKISMIEEKLEAADDVDMQQRYRERESQDYKILFNLYVEHKGAWQKEKELEEAIVTHLGIYKFLEQDELLEKLKADYDEYQMEHYGMLLVR